MRDELISEVVQRIQEPDIVTAPFDAELSFSADEEQEVIRLKNDNKRDDFNIEKGGQVEIIESKTRYLIQSNDCPLKGVA